MLVVLAFGTVMCSTQRLDGFVVDYPFSINAQVSTSKDIIATTLKHFHVNPDIVLDEKVRSARTNYHIKYLYVLTINLFVVLE